MIRASAAAVACLVLCGEAYGYDWYSLDKFRDTRQCFECDLTDTKMPGATLIHMTVRNSDLRRADFKNANMENGEIAESDLREADLTNVRLRFAILIGTDFRNAKLAGAELIATQLRWANFGDADLRGVDFGGSGLFGTLFIRANMSGAKLFNVTELTQRQLDAACGDDRTLLPEGFRIEPCEAPPLPWSGAGPGGPRPPAKKQPLITGEQ